MAGRGGGHCDDHAGACGEVVQEGGDGQERGRQVDVDDFAPVFGSLGAGRDRRPGAAGERGENVDRSELVMDVFLELLEVGWEGAVGDEADGPASFRLDGLDNGVERGSVAADDRDAGAVGGQGAGGGRSDAARAAGHYGGLVGEIGIVRLC